MKPLEETSLDEVIDTTKDLQKADVATVRDIVDQLGTASFLPLVLLIALIVVTPLSGVPGLSGFSGVTIALIAGQLLLGRDRLWLPEVILRREVPKGQLHAMLKRIRKPLRLMQDHTTQRLGFLASGPAAQVLLVICILCGLAMPFLEVIPATSSMLAGAVTLLTISIISRDGLIALSGLISLTMALAVLAYLTRTLFGLF